MDITTLDSIQHAVIETNDYIDRDELSAFEDDIKQQYIEFDNLGIDVLSNLNFPNKNYLIEIYQDLLSYVNENYISIVDYDNTMSSIQKLYEVGEYVYKFICVEGFNSIIPKFVSNLECTDIDQFDQALRIKFGYNFNLIKASLLKCAKSTSEEFLRLQKIDPTIINDANYLRLVNRHSYYIELIDFGNTERFITNYIRPVLSKNFAQILWRTM
jgi:hypothetical protein